MLHSTLITSLFLFHFGQPTNSDYIVGGVNTTIEKHPHQIALFYNGDFKCGGSLIAPDLVATAAHCTAARSKYIDRFSIRVGSNLANTGGEVISLQNIYIHSKYLSSQSDYDVSVVQLQKKVNLSSKVRPIKIASIDSLLPVGAVGTVTGWGLLKEDDFNSLSRVLQEVKVPKVSNQDCAKDYPKSNITTRMICFGYQLGEKDACQGDSGGPLIWNDVLVGVISWGYGCARPNKPGVYTNIANSEINEFITQYLNSSTT